MGRRRHQRRSLTVSGQPSLGSDDPRNTPGRKRCCGVGVAAASAGAAGAVLGAGSCRATFRAACEAAGVERHQGYRWRKAAGGRIPPVPRVGCGRCLSLPERLQIADLRLAGKGVREIAAELGRAPSTISRELARNRVAKPQPSRRGVQTVTIYAPYAAHTAAQVRGAAAQAGQVRAASARCFRGGETGAAVEPATDQRRTRSAAL